MYALACVGYYLLVHFNTNCSLCDIPHYTCLPMVILVRHALQEKESELLDHAQKPQNTTAEMAFLGKQQEPVCISPTDTNTLADRSHSTIQV